MWTRIPPGVKNTYLNNTCTPVQHTRSEGYVSEQYIYCTLLFITPGVKNTYLRFWTIHTLLFITPGVKNTYLRFWTIHTLLFITPGVKNKYLDNAYCVHSCSSHHEWRIRIWTINTVHSCSSHKEWKIRIWTIHTLLFTTRSEGYVSNNTYTPVHHTRSEGYVQYLSEHSWIGRSKSERYVRAYLDILILSYMECSVSFVLVFVFIFQGVKNRLFGISGHICVCSPGCSIRSEWWYVPVQAWYR